MKLHYDLNRDPVKLGRYYTDHVAAMTREGLHSKSDIAAELAYRDLKIDVLLKVYQAAVDEHSGKHFESECPLCIAVREAQKIEYVATGDTDA
jgi:hypothetical protein